LIEKELAYFENLGIQVLQGWEKIILSEFIKSTSQQTGKKVLLIFKPNGFLRMPQRDMVISRAGGLRSVSELLHCG